jgi:hypothetical protein
LEALGAVKAIMIDDTQNEKNHEAVIDFREHCRKKREVDFGRPFEAEWFNAGDHYTEMKPDFQLYKLTRRRRSFRVRRAARFVAECQQEARLS